MQTSTLERKYHDRLNNIPRPGEGRHRDIMGISNLGVLAGIALEQIHDDIRKAAGPIPLSESEIRKTVLKAAAEHTVRGSTYVPPPKTKPLVKKEALQRIIAQGTIRDDADLFEISPIRLNSSPEQDPVTLLTVLFNPGEWVFIGDRLEAGVIGKNIRTVTEWIKFFLAGGKAGPFIIINPFSGQCALTKSGDNSFRCDGSVKAFRHCLVEFDHLGMEEQLRFWSAAKLPILALIDSGGKSIHAWLDVQKLSSVTTCDEWTREIKTGLYEKVLIPLGVDRTCCNPSRLSRLPGVLRPETGRFQRLLWLSPEGREVTRC